MSVSLFCSPYLYIYGIHLEAFPSMGVGDLRAACIQPDYNITTRVNTRACDELLGGNVGHCCPQAGWTGMIFRISTKVEIERKPGGQFWRLHLQENLWQTAFPSGSESSLKTVAGDVSFADLSGN